MTTIVTRAGKGSPLTNTEVDTNFTNLNSAKLENTNNLSDVSSVATARTNLGLAIGTNVQAWDADLDAIAALAGTSGFLKKTAANTWTLDTSTYLTSNQTITLSGDASGSGTTAITVTLATVGATKGGTGQTTYATGDTLYASATNTLSKLSGNITATKQFLSQTGTGAVSAAPVWSAVTKSDVGLANVENTALSTWAGSANITTLGTIATGTWQGSIIGSTYGGTGVNNAGRTLTINTNSGTIAFTNLSTTLTVANTASVSGTNTGDQTITLTGDVTGSGTGSFATTLATVAAAKGGTGQTTYAVGDLLYASGTSALSKLAGNTSATKQFLSQTGTGTASAAPAWATLTKTDVGLANVENTALSTWAGSTNLTTLGTISSGTWQGSVISSTYGGTGVNNGGRTLTINTNSGSLTFTNLSTTLTIANTASVSGTNTGDQTITLTGDVTGSGTGSFAATLATVNANTGSFGSASVVPVITVNGKGLITAVSTAAISAGITISDDTTTNATRYPVFEDVTSGSSSAAQVSSTKLTFNPSTGTLTATVMAASSDENLKTNWRELPDLIEGMANVKTGEFDWLDGSGSDVGVSAQSLMGVLAGAVKSAENGQLSVNYGAAALVTCVQLCKRIVTLEAKLRQAGVYM